MFKQINLGKGNAITTNYSLGISHVLSVRWQTIPYCNLMTDFDSIGKEHLGKDKNPSLESKGYILPRGARL
jgi:hypothetical protein